jgi:hypothetical protein
MVNRDVAWEIIFGTGRSTQSERQALSAGAVAMRIIAGRAVRRDIIEKDGAFIEERLGQLNALFGTSWKKAPTWAGIPRSLLKLDATQVEEVVRLHAEKQVSAQPGIQFIALDGKALRGSASRVMGLRARQFVSAFRQDDLIILGHVEVADNSNEIPAVQSLMISGRVFRLDAMHCQNKHLR